MGVNQIEKKNKSLVFQILLDSVKIIFLLQVGNVIHL